MGSRGRLLHRASLGAVLVAAAAVALAGCSSTSSPTESQVVDWGSLVGSVSSDRGTPLAGIEVHLWGQVDAGRTAVQYDVVTGADGTYEIEEIDLSHVATDTEIYELYVNRTKSSALPINDAYRGYAAAVTIEKGEVTTADAVIAEEDAVGPAQFLD